LSQTPIEVTPTQQVRASGDTLLPVIAKIEDVLVGEDQVLAFFSLIAIAIINQYPGMTDEQISKGIDRTAINITQMCQEFEFENLLKERQAAEATKKAGN
jgi:hypothetical protein